MRKLTAATFQAFFTRLFYVSGMWPDSCGLNFGNRSLSKMAWNEHTAADQARERMSDKLHDASRYGKLELMRSLLDKKADPNGLDRGFSTPLVWACMCGKVEAVEMLLAGADTS